MDRFAGANYATIDGLRYYRDFDPDTNLSGSVPNAAGLNSFQEEIMGVIEHYLGVGSGNAANLKQMLAAIQAGITAALTPYAQTPPLVARSAHGIALGADYNGTLTLSFTAPSAGSVVAMGMINTNGITNGSIITSLLEINGSASDSDGTTEAQGFATVLTVASGASVTVTFNVSTTADPGVDATYRVTSFFLPTA